MTSQDNMEQNSSFYGMPVRLDVFEGPLDLLLHLIRESKVDITDIPIADITRQYLDYLDLMRTLSLDVASEFLVMAATLVHIKSRMLLPEEKTEDGEEGEDPRRELIQQLLEYEQYKGAGLMLGDLEETRGLLFGRESLGPEDPKRTDFPIEVSLFDLLSALKKVMESVPEELSLEIESDRLTIADRISQVLDFLKGIGEVPFESLFEDSRDVSVLIITFVAVLELIRLRMVRAWQAVPYGRVMVCDIRPDDDGAGEDNGGT